MRRREFILVVCSAVAWPGLGSAQKQPLPKVGVLWHAASAEEEASIYTSFIEGFRDLGYVDRRNIIFEHRFPNEVPERFKSMAAELVSLNVDVLVGVGNNASPYARNATSTIPVVFILVADPVGTNLVDDLARPSGNATGMSNFSDELIGKRLQILKEIIPGLSDVALLVNPGAKVSRLYVGVFQAAADHLGLRVHQFEARLREELEPAFETINKARVQALFTNADGLAFTQRTLIAQLALKHRLPLAVWAREPLLAGAFISYGADPLAISRRTAVYVDKILKGTKPSELPVEQASKFEFLINLKTAKALGLTIPPGILARADEVIE
jgi:putative tryptophan/tyrosine transport system substrate-binding protein